MQMGFHEVWDIVSNMKQLVEKEPDKAKQMFVSHPQVKILPVMSFFPPHVDASSVPRLCVYVVGSLRYQLSCDGRRYDNPMHWVSALCCFNDVQHVRSRALENRYRGTSQRCVWSRKWRVECGKLMQRRIRLSHIFSVGRICFKPLIEATYPRLSSFFIAGRRSITPHASTIKHVQGRGCAVFFQSRGGCQVSSVTINHSIP